MDTQEKKTVQEAEAPVVNTMSEDQLFSFAEYNAQEAEKIGYSN